MVQKITLESVKCFIVLTNTARQALKEHFQDEHAFFKLQNPFDVYIEKQSIEQTSISLTLYFDNKRNTNLNKKFGGRVVIMDCIFDLKNGLVAKSFRTRGANTPVVTNRRERMRIHLVPSRINGHTYPEKFITTIAQLPVAQERFDYVNKRISSWEGYLKVLYKNASIDDIDATFTSSYFNEDYSKVTLRCNGIDDKEWKQLKGLSAYVKGYPREIGEVTKVNRQDRTVEIELNAKLSRLFRNNEFDFTSEYITFSNASTKSQLNRLLKGFDRLKEGLAANINLENILFEDQPTIAERKKDVKLDFYNNLNEYQRAAVTGAISAEDLYVIQGPPGTGKTTVISEICYQNAKAGLKTLIASQSNLAVDNALGRLLSNKDIRILRYGRTESIEEEGKKFIEENVADYWKEQTYDAITNEIKQHQTKEEQLQQEIYVATKEIEALKENEQQLQQEILKKQQAKEQLEKTIAEIAELKKQIIPLKKEREKTEETLEKLRTSKEKIDAKIEELTKLVRPSKEINEEILTAQEKLSRSKQLIRYVEAETQLQKLENEITNVNNQLEQINAKTNEISSTIEKVKSFKKIYDIEEFIVQQEIRRGYVLSQLFSDMEKLHGQIEQFKPLKDISARLEKAIEYSHKTLGIQIQASNLPPNQHYSLQEVNEFLTELSKAFAQKKINAFNGTRSIEGLYSRKMYLAQLSQRYKALINESVLVFTKIKDEVIEQILMQTGVEQSTIDSLNIKKANLQLNASQLKEQLDSIKLNLGDVSVVPSIEELQSVCHLLQTEIAELEETKSKQTDIESQLQNKQEEQKRVDSEILNGESVLKDMINQLKELNSKGIQLEKDVQQLEQITKQNPESELEKTKEKIVALEEQIEKLNLKIEMLPITQELQVEWKGLLDEATEHDLDEIRKLYVKHANVIGTTCVASANKEFMDNYPIFDVVIIDEVSKATPPELLLPMLKGKKIVLVGDHHQLPPLIGDDTFEETLETVIKESNTFEEKRELEKLLEESLFERLYKNLPSSNKKMLAIQYRMHENIMKTIAPFYEHEGDSLKCGLPDSDAARDHKLESNLIKRSDHLLWIDLPNEPNYFEERMKEGSSLLNQEELKTIRAMLVDLNHSTEVAKKQGLIPEDERKSVGVISFYAEQVKCINRMIEHELHLPHLHIRTGSVDKFQGMEMDVILVSMVRNNDNKNGEIGFAKDYRRLNVALSRARELLVLIGSVDMFTKRPKKEQTRNMYSKLLSVVKSQDGYRNVKELTS